ncbi:hypothetical protein HY346_01765 [Candidatus Microgenomates bacterium]|nr:hypothetical protein [Candidatus Microgenomates bacterium]
MIWLLLLGLVLGITLLLLIMKRSPRPKKLHGTVNYDRDYVARKWQEIELANRHGQSKQAVIEADKLLDYVLKALRFDGVDMAHRLGNARSTFSDSDGLWEAHRLRNRLVHETNFNLLGEMANRALAAFRQALTDMRAL